MTHCFIYEHWQVNIKYILSAKPWLPVLNIMILSAKMSVLKIANFQSSFEILKYSEIYKITYFWEHRKKAKIIIYPDTPSLKWATY